MLIVVVSRNPELVMVAKSMSSMDADVEVIELRRASDLIRKMTRVAVDLVILDAEREFECAEIILSWRYCHSRMDFAVVIVGRLLGWRNMARAFDLGVDDIVVGSLRVDELYVRGMRCVEYARRDRRPKRAIIGPFSLDERTQCIAGYGMSVQLTGQEFALALLFFSKPGVLFSKERIAATIWGRSGRDCSRTLEQAIYRLRCKLQLLSDDGLRINAVYAQGYKLAVTNEQRRESCNDGSASGPRLAQPPVRRRKRLAIRQTAAASIWR